MMTNRTPLETLMSRYPCTFNITPEIDSDAKLREVQGKLKSEIQHPGDDTVNDIRNRNLLTWIEYKLGDLRSAVQQNEDVIRMTNSNDMVSLGNRVFLLKEKGENYDSAFQSLKALTLRPDAGKLMGTAKADQAYSYARIGGPKNQQYAIDLYVEALQIEPDNFHWKFGLGLALRRSIHKEMARSPEFRMSFAQRVKEGARVLFEVAETDSQRNLFRKRAYGELAFMRGLVEQQKDIQGGMSVKEIFRNMTKVDLDGKAKNIRE
ncbi:unnamed protein product [Lymnaea stagnalis]|uniref:Tetratricopeptide repeat protein n=1 Tax=Lymnaea stagnalis TaxID=6523 RepID=A0AAV2GZU6_LYMST